MQPPPTNSGFFLPKEYSKNTHCEHMNPRITKNAWRVPQGTKQLVWRWHSQDLFGHFVSSLVRASLKQKNTKTELAGTDAWSNLWAWEQIASGMVSERHGHSGCLFFCYSENSKYKQNSNRSKSKSYAGNASGRGIFSKVWIPFYWRWQKSSPQRARKETSGSYQRPFHRFEEQHSVIGRREGEYIYCNNY